MADITGIFSGKNELAKFLAIGGLLTIIFGFYYPLEKTKEYNLQKIKVKYETQELILIASDLQNSYNEADKQLKNIENRLISEKLSDAEKSKLGQEVKLLKQITTDKKFQFQTKNIGVEKLNEELLVLEKYESKYNNYFWIAICVGVAMTIVGFIAWSKSGLLEHKKNKLP